VGVYVDAESIITISAAVVALTQFAKWGGVPDRHGPIAVMLISVLGVSLWALSSDAFWQSGRAMIWPLFSAWIAVTTSAAGVFGFTRASKESITSTSKPPNDGAGSSATL
jgi:hypothetical protein